jgi:hypothetical protein
MGRCVYRRRVCLLNGYTVDCIKVSRYSDSARLSVHKIYNSKEE